MTTGYALEPVIGRAILEALIDGEADPDKLLTLVQRGVKAPPETLRAALQGRVTVRHRFLLRLHLRQVDALDAAMAEIDAEVDRDLDPFRQAVRLLRTIPGVSDLTAQVIVSEISVDGKRRSTRLRKGAPWLKTTLVQCAWAGARKRPATCKPSSSACVTGAAPRRRSAPSPPQS